MNRHKLGLYIGQAIIWAAVLIGCAIALDGDAFGDVLPILSGGAIASVVVIPAAVLRSNE